MHFGKGVLMLLEKIVKAYENNKSSYEMLKELRKLWVDNCKNMCSVEKRALETQITMLREVVDTVYSYDR